jgi:hypothetical protein
LRCCGASGDIHAPAELVHPLGWRDHQFLELCRPDLLFGTTRGRWRGGSARMDCHPPQPSSDRTLPPSRTRPWRCNAPLETGAPKRLTPSGGVEDRAQRLSLCSVAPFLAPTGVTAPRPEMCVNAVLRLGRSFLHLYLSWSREADADCVSKEDPAHSEDALVLRDDHCVISSG